MLGNREFGTFSLQSSSVSVHNVHFMVYTPSRKVTTWQFRTDFSETKNQPREEVFRAGRPCGHPAKNFGQALQVLEKHKFWHGHAAWTSTKKLQSDKLLVDFFVP